ncbi:HNH endonuclease [Salinarimonas soli]|uniref:HNH endonuclease n=1 Tax=Salinarimonas soli TaxID=1638099 RepID=A0A5B2VBZ0_9HYPH|nr:HNH endonuclease [Salinarimonas soli]KAA2235819.1 HNH endonuclease [Salinarimonas soli]
MPRRNRLFAESAPAPEPHCPLCDRPIPPGAKSSRHHLTPKLKGGANGAIVRLHQICHSAIHARFSEAEIARRLADVESLRHDPEMARFLEWVRTKPPDFHAPTRLTKARKGARRDR